MARFAGSLNQQINRSIVRDSQGQKGGGARGSSALSGAWGKERLGGMDVEALGG